MKQSIKKIFSNLSLFLIFATIFAGVSVLFAINHNSSYEKMDNLVTQKSIVLSLTKLQKDDIELALIQFNGKSTQLHNEIEKLRSLYQYNFTEQYILENSEEYLSDLDKLSTLTTSFNQKARKYYNQNNVDDKQIKKELDGSFYALYNQINSIIFKGINYNKVKFNIHKNITFIVFIIILLITVLYRRKLNAIYEDLNFLYRLDKTDYKIFSEEADAILLRMNRKPTVSNSPTMLDPVTGINNHKGMVNSYSEKKGMKESNFTSVTVIEIDNFSKSNRAYSQEFTQNILKKVAFTISLHEQSTDVIARTDYNQFTIILSRGSREKSFKEIDVIRESVSDIKFKSDATGSIKVTVSGGFTIKSSNITLDEAVRESKKVLNHAKTYGGNKVSQIRDLEESTYIEGNL